MYIYAVHLENFRSFGKLWIFPNSDINVFIGPNNCGKSTVLHALALLLDASMSVRQPDVVSRFDFHNLNHEESIELRVWLKPRHKKASQEDETQLVYDERDEIKKAFFDKLSEWQLQIEIGHDPKGQEEKHPKELTPYLVDQPMNVPPSTTEHESLLAIRLCATWNENQAVADVEIGIINQMGDEIAPFGIKQRELLGFKLLGARRNPVYELSMARRSILSQMLDETEINLALRQLLAELDKSKDSLLKKATVIRLLNTLNSLVSPNLLGALAGNVGTQFTMTFLSGELWRLRGATSIATNVADSDGEVALPLEYQGDGVQNLLLLAQILGVLRENQLDSIIALEEPEQNLEPSLARWIFGELCTISYNPVANDQDAAKEAPRRGQIFVTTHSPALVNELRGPESLIVFAEARQSTGDSEETIPGSTTQPLPQSSYTTVALRCLSSERRKKLDQERERYANALFARQVLVAEGPSEVGFLPVAFRYFSKGKPYDNPYHLGMEVVNAGGKGEAPKHSEFLKAYGRRCHILLDHDTDDDEKQIKSKFEGKADFVTCWPNKHLLDFTQGCDMEVILVAYTPPDILFRALQTVYKDAGHGLLPRDWEKACKEITDSQLTASFPDVANGLTDIKIEEVGDERTRRAFLYALLHGPHSCKSTKEMRIIAQVLEEHDAIPVLMDDLRAKIVKSILAPWEVDHEQPYLAAR